MSIQVAQAVIRNNDVDNIPRALEEIQNAIKSGYILCRINEAIEKMRFERERCYYLQSSRYIDMPNELNWREFYTKGFEDGIKIIKECCE